LQRESTDLSKRPEMTSATREAIIDGFLDSDLL